MDSDKSTVMVISWSGFLLLKCDYTRQRMMTMKLNDMLNVYFGCMQVPLGVLAGTSERKQIG
jgi:hypothetical protein